MKYVTIKAYDDTRLLLRLIAATTGEQMVQVLDRLCRAELERVASEAKADGRLIILAGHTTKGRASVDNPTAIIIDRLQSFPRSGNNPADNADGGGENAGDDAV